MILYFETDGLLKTYNYTDPSTPNVLAVVIDDKTHYIKQAKGYTVPKHITDINGITDEKLANGYTIKEIVNILYKVVGEKIYTFSIAFQETLFASLFHKDQEAEPYFFVDSPYDPGDDVKKIPKPGFIDLLELARDHVAIPNASGNFKYPSFKECVAKFNLEGSKSEMLKKLKDILVSGDTASVGKPRKLSLKELVTKASNSSGDEHSGWIVRLCEQLKSYKSNFAKRYTQDPNVAESCFNAAVLQLVKHYSNYDNIHYAFRNVYAQALVNEVVTYNTIVPVKRVTNIMKATRSNYDGTSLNDEKMTNLTQKDLKYITKYTNSVSIVKHDKTSVTEDNDYLIDLKRALSTLGELNELVICRLYGLFDYHKTPKRSLIEEFGKGVVDRALRALKNPDFKDLLREYV
jgi:hypothetical protein